MGDIINLMISPLDVNLSKSLLEYPYHKKRYKRNNECDWRNYKEN